MALSNRLDVVETGYTVVWSGDLERRGLAPGLSHDNLPSQLATSALLIERREVPSSEWHYITGSGTDAPSAPWSSFGLTIRTPPRRRPASTRC